MCKSVVVWNVMCKFMEVQKYRVMGKYWGGGGGMEVSGANMGVGDNGGNVSSGVPRPSSPSRTQPRQPSRP